MVVGKSVVDGVCYVEEGRWWVLFLFIFYEKMEFGGFSNGASRPCWNPTQNPIHPLA